MRALIVEHGVNRGALAAARALASAGWTVDVIAGRASYTTASRDVRSWSCVRYPEGGTAEFVESVARVVRENGSDVVFPVDETQLLILSRYREQLKAVFPYPPHEVVERSTDRLEQAKIAQDAGLAVPPTMAASVEALEGRAGKFALKSRRPALLSGDGGGSRLETRVGTQSDLLPWIADLEREGIEAILQDAIAGRLTSVTVLTDPRGKLVADMQQAAHRLWPPEAGVSARASTTAVDLELRHRVLAFLEGLGWHGFAQLQFILDHEGTPHLIDFNPRFYGSLSLAIAAGVNFPALWGALATGRVPPPAAPARPGVRYHWVGGDLRRAVREHRGGLMRDVGRSLTWGVAAVHPIWSIRDPNPGVRCSAQFLRRLIPPRHLRRSP